MTTKPMRKVQLLLIGLLIITGALVCGCSKKSEPQPSTKQQQTVPPPLPQGTATAPTSDSSRQALNTLPPKSDSYYVLDRRSNTIYGIDLNTDKISNRYLRTDKLTALQYDPERNWLYEGIDDPSAGLDVYDLNEGKYVQKFRFPGAPTAMLYHPIQRRLYLISEDSTNFRVFYPDSVKIGLSMPMQLQERKPISPKSLGPGPGGKLITTNSAHPSVTQILTEYGYMLQTVIIHNADHIDDAVFAFDGNSSFSCDTKQGAMFRVEFGTGKVMAERYQLKSPRLVQIEVTSNTLIYVEGDNQLVMLNPDTFRETGRVSLAEYGERVTSFLIPPKANYAELTIDYKGVTRWMRFDVRSWKPTRMVELL